MMMMMQNKEHNNSHSSLNAMLNASESLGEYKKNVLNIAVESFIYFASIIIRKSLISEDLRTFTADTEFAGPSFRHNPSIFFNPVFVLIHQFF